MKNRKINRAKRVDRGCRNHGSCDYCKNSRTYSNKHREPLEDTNMIECYDFNCYYHPGEGMWCDKEECLKERNKTILPSYVQFLEGKIQEMAYEMNIEESRNYELEQIITERT